MFLATVLTGFSRGESPYQRHVKDLESGGGSGGGFHEIVPTKSASVDRLKKWRQVAILRNALRLFHHTLDLKNEEEKKQIIAKFRTHAQVIRAAYLFQAHGEKQDGTPSPIPTGTFNVSPGQRISSLTRDNGLSSDNQQVQEEVEDTGRRVGENVNSAHWMFKDNIGKWVAFAGTYCTMMGVFAAFIAMKFSGKRSVYGTHGWYIVTSVISLIITMLTSWIIFYTNNLKNAMREHSKTQYKMILNSVFLFCFIMSPLSLVLTMIIPREINAIGFAIFGALFMVVFGFGFKDSIKAIWKRACR